MTMLFYTKIGHVMQYAPSPVEISYLPHGVRRSSLLSILLVPNAPSVVHCAVTLPGSGLVPMNESRGPLQ